MNPFVEKARYRLVPELDDGLLGLTEAEWCWCAGLFEGEGSIATMIGGSKCVSACVNMTDRDVLEKLDYFWPSKNGVRIKEHGVEHWKTLYSWAISKRGYVHNFLGGIYPYMGERRQARIIEAFELLAHKVPDIVQRHEERAARRRELILLSENHRDDSKRRTHCFRGHPLADNNLLIAKRSDGYIHRKCKTCEYENKRIRQTIAAAQSGSV